MQALGLSMQALGLYMQALGAYTQALGVYMQALDVYMQASWLSGCGKMRPGKPWAYICRPWTCICTVSYTHLTLPTKRIV